MSKHMTNNNYTELSHSDDCEKYVNQFIQEFPLRSAEIGQGTVIKRALPSRHKRMIGAWCFLDGPGPVTFPQGDGLDVRPHPHIGLQTFTWMIEGTMMHTDSLGQQTADSSKTGQPHDRRTWNSHTEVAPDTETKMHAAQLWIALPDAQIAVEPRFDHYPELPVVEKDGVAFTILVGEFLNTHLTCECLYRAIRGGLSATESTKTRLTLNPNFEYGFMALEGTATVNGHELTEDNMVVLEQGVSAIEIEIHAGSHLLLLGGEPFESPILLWWNFVGRTQEELKIARDQWIAQDERFRFHS